MQIDALALVFPHDEANKQVCKISLPPNAKRTPAREASI